MGQIWDRNGKDAGSTAPTVAVMAGPKTLTSAAVIAIAVCAISATPALAASGQTAPKRQRATSVAAAPEAAEFARDVVGTTTAYAVAHGDPARIENVDCVQAAPGHYMCSYAVTRPKVPRECHLMQAIWTPERDSTYTVTLAGRVHNCLTLRDALRSLR